MRLRTKQGEIEGDHERTFFAAGLGSGGWVGGVRGRGQTVDQGRGLEDRLEQEQAAPRVIVMGEGEERPAQGGVGAPEAVGTGDQPEVELVLDDLERAKLGLEVFGVLDEVAGNGP